MKDKLIITAALAGGATTKNNNPNTPYTPEEFAEETYRCLQEGVSIVHIHAKDPATGMATVDVQAHRDVIGAIRDRCPEMILNISTGAMQTPAAARIASALDLKPELASFNTNSMNFAVANHKTGEIWMEFIYDNTFAMMEDFARKMKENNIKPESEIFDPGGLYNTLLLRRKGDLFTEPMHFQFVYGVAGGMQFDPLLHLSLAGQLPKDATYSVCGIGPHQYKAALLSAISGGHIRIGLEDNVRIPGGELAKGSWEQAIWVRDVAKIAGRPIATPAETREMLKLKKKE
jgi:3-keto-5-aminohexanoate cleavage enzyme